MPDPHSCRLCGATSYRPVKVREDGVVRAIGLYRCAGCSVVFEDPESWREAGPEWEPPAPQLSPATTSLISPITKPRPPDLSRYGASPVADD